ncbi:MAG: AI-2E family transporter [Myxococcales bacterium]|nr:AI-2E family transporter [Myxococcales bacterium]
MITMTQQAIERLGGRRFYRRLLALGGLLLVLVAFRHLALVGVSFVVFTAALGWLGARLAMLVGGSRRQGVVIVLLVLLALASVAVFLFVRLGSSAYQQLMQGPSFTIRIAELEKDILDRLPPWVPVNGIKEKAPALVAPAITYVRATGKILLHVLMGLILAIVYLLDPDEVDALLRALHPESVSGTLYRYFGYLAEAVLITIQLQILVALVNTVLTLPVLFLLRLPHIPTFTAVIFLGSLVPVVGNLISGAVLIIASYTYRGLLGVALFVGITFVLHKIEAYYLNPRLTARHVRLPALVLILSLLAFEHMFGLVGLFLSFPALYVGIKIWQDFQLQPPPHEGPSAVS